MNNQLVLIDYIVFGLYFVILSSYGYYVYVKNKAAAGSSTQDFFLAEGSLTWWAIGASLIHMIQCLLFKR